MQKVQTTAAAGSAAPAPSPEVVVPVIAADFREWLERSRTQFENALVLHLQEIEANFAPHSRLPAAVLYSLKLGGKRLRPILVLETCRVCGGRAEVAMPAALAMECVHTFSLIHDDLPAMDDDDTRRGQPTNHKVFGEGLAVLAGDWLVTHAFGLLVSDRYDRGIVPALVQALADGTRGMIEGQGADLAGEERPVERDLVRFIHLHKTAALLETCCRLGALCAGASGDAVRALGRYGQHLGLAFQIVDDVLDVTSSSEQMGKRVGKDSAANKQTYPAAFGLSESYAQARREIDAALHVLDCFGGRADRLRDLGRYVISRDH
jgi:geranylgeranyl diphosphate synthase, type II